MGQSSPARRGNGLSIPTLAVVLALHKAGHQEEAERGYRAIVAATANADAMQLLATLLHQRGESAEALNWLDRAMPHLAQRDAAESNRSALLLALGRHDEALATAIAVLARQPGHVGARRNRDLARLALARAVTDLITRVDAWTAYLADVATATDAWLEYGNALQNIGESEVAVAAFDAAQQAWVGMPEVASAALIAAHFEASATTASLAARARTAAAQYVQQAPSMMTAGERDADTFGFYSPRFGDGPIASLILPVLRELRANGVRIVLYSGVDHEPEDARAYREIADVFHDIGALDDAGFLVQADADRVGVMFDLCGHAPGNRLRSFAARLAPLQVSWGDWFCTTGLPEMDVFIGDTVTTPPQEDDLFAERVWRLPTRFVHALPADTPAPSDTVPEQPRFASFNRLSKLTGATSAAWAQILRRVPDATLLLRSGGLEQASLRQHVAARFSAQGVDPQRIEFEPFGSYAETLARYRNVRVALDPFPFNGCVTTLDALAMHVPVVALRGHSVVARQSAALLAAIDRTEWIAQDIDEYIDTAARLIDARTNLDARRMLGHAVPLPIFDVPRYTEGLLGAIREVQTAR